MRARRFSVIGFFAPLLVVMTALLASYEIGLSDGQQGTDLESVHAATDHDHPEAPGDDCCHPGQFCAGATMSPKPPMASATLGLGQAIAFGHAQDFRSTPIGFDPPPPRLS